MPQPLKYSICHRARQEHVHSPGPWAPSPATHGKRLQGAPVIACLAATAFAKRPEDAANVASLKRDELRALILRQGTVQRRVDPMVGHGAWMGTSPPAVVRIPAIHPQNKLFRCGHPRAGPRQRGPPGPKKNPG